MSKFLLIGQSVWDFIHLDEEIVNQAGGITYSVLGMKSISNTDDEIFLLSSISGDTAHLFNNVFDNLNKRFLKTVDKIPKVHLIQKPGEERCENYENITDKLVLPEEIEYNIFDGILINMITGFDISLDDIITLRKKYNGIIYIDIHTLSRGLSSDMKREFRKIPDVKEWLLNVDIVQVNENEIFTLSELKSELEIAQEIINYGVTIFIITFGDKGAKIFFKMNDEIISYFVSGLKVEVKNKIGCGDIFGSVFFYYFIKENNIIKSLKLANMAGGLSAGYKKFNQYSELKSDLFKRYY